MYNAINAISFENNNKSDVKMSIVAVSKRHNSLKGLLFKNNIKQRKMIKMINIDPSTFNFLDCTFNL